MNRHITTTRTHLGNLAALSEQTDRTESEILAKAEERLSKVQAAIERLRPGIESAPDADQKRYLDLVSEVGQLNVVIGKARAATK